MAVCVAAAKGCVADAGILRPQKVRREQGIDEHFKESGYDRTFSSRGV